MSTPNARVTQLEAELEHVDHMLEEMWRTVYGDAPMPGEPGFGPAVRPRRHFLTSLRWRLAEFSWPWHEGKSDAEIRRIALKTPDAPRPLRVVAPEVGR